MFELKEQVTSLQAELKMKGSQFDGEKTSCCTLLTITIFLANSADNELVIFFLFFPDNRI